MVLTRLIHITLLSSAGLFALSLIFPAVVYHSRYEVGFSCLLFGWVGLLAGYYPWLANPLFFVTVILVKRKSGLAILTGLFSLGFALSTHFFREVPDDSGHQTIHSFGAGYFLWLLSIFLVTLAAAFSGFGRKNESL